ncbi:serine protease HTRA1B-like [Dunckerocampus dactyliophorus]|uniref:serine protease HTRA1B-like n=1 Tax=Dunckerocampus dactyliophorus TaxID=161453 RepID=UPI0024074FFA|nr:serine protease HTRA1B-like [Dunckerocampus dactyliophorus]
MKGNCTLQIRNIQKTDNFLFRVIDSVRWQSFTMPIGTTVRVIDGTQMVVSSSTPTNVKEGDSVTLRCTSSCSFHQLDVLWIRDGLILHESGPTLQLGPLTACQSGQYMCALARDKRTVSQPFTLNVTADQTSLQNPDDCGCWKNNAYSDLFVKVAPAVIHIKIHHDVTNPEQEASVTGTSGFIVSEDGLIVTKAHMVANEDRVQVELRDGTAFDARVKVLDEVANIALLKIDPATTNLTFLPIGQANDLRFGELVVAFGRKSSRQVDVVTGIIQGVGKERDLDNSDILYIKTDIFMDYGNSGGPLVTMGGEVVGINSQMVTSSWNGAIPSFKISDLLDQAKGTNGNKKYVGMRMMSLTSALAAELKEKLGDFPDVTSGAYIFEVFSQTPAEAAGLKYRDVIIKVNGEPVTSASDVSAAIKQDHMLRVVVKRGKEDVILSIVPKEIDP